MKFLEELHDVFKGEIDTSPATLDKYSEDTSIFSVRPCAVVFPKDVCDLRLLLRVANRYKGEVSLTARSAGTDMSGGPLTSSVVVDFLRYFNKVKYVDDKIAITEPGVFYRDFEPLTLKHGVILPSYTASRELNTVGGMVANNSAGEKSLTYGKTERYVQSLKVMLFDGEEYEFSKLSRTEWEQKKQLQTNEGRIYLQIDKLITENLSCLQSEKPIVSKNSAGYSLWNIYNAKDDTFDLTQLFVGSQGTLGFITEITFRLVAVPEKTRMLIIFLGPKHLPVLGEVINQVLEFKPESFESYDDKTFNVMLKVFPKLMRRLGGNIFKITVDFLPEMKMVLAKGIPKLVLMAEFSGTDEQELISNVKKAESAIRSKYDLATHVTESKAEAEKFWIIRRESFKLLRENVKGLHTAPFIDDISVAPEYLPLFLPKLYKILDEYKLIYTVAGHVGDGNFHIIPLMDFSHPDFAKVVQELSDKVYTLIGEYKGSITGEHNDGLIRTPYLHKMFSPEMLRLFAQTKDIFDKKRIFNPNKKVDGDMDLLIKSIKKNSKN